MRKILETRVCDRCSKEQDIRESENLYDWGLIAVRQINGTQHIGRGAAETFTRENAYDMCPACTKEVIAWWKEPKED